MFKEKLQAVKIQITTINFTTPCLERKKKKTLCDLLINQKLYVFRVCCGCIQRLNYLLYSSGKNEIFFYHGLKVIYHC